MRSPDLAAALLVGLWLCAASPTPACPAPPVGAGQVHLDVPFFAQSELLCGGASAAMLMRYWGDLSAEPGQFAALVDEGRGGILTEDLVDRLTAGGWQARVTRGDPGNAARWLREGRPWIALLGLDARRLHYVVVVGWSDAAVTVHDPADGPSRRIERDRFLEAWDLTGRWALLVLPGERVLATPTRAPETDTGADSRTSPAVRRAVQAARAGRPEDAVRILDEALDHDPGDSGAWRELAGLHFSRSRWVEAMEAARRACSVDSGDTHARRLLAASAYMAGASTEALVEWNRLGEPRVGFIEISGARLTNYASVESALGVARGDLLTPARLRLARRRTEAIPAIERARVDYRMQRDGTVALEVHVLEESRWPDARLLLAGQGARALANQSLAAGSANLFGRGDLWTISARPQRARRALAFTAAMPGFPSSTWVARLTGGWERESYAAGPRVDTMTYRLAEAEVGHWLTARWGVGLSVAARRPAAGGLEAGGGLSLRHGTLDDRLRARLAIDAFVDRDRDRLLPGMSTELSWRSSARRRGMRLLTRFGGTWVDPLAPRWRWPGAGVGIARPYLLRAHPLLNDGVISGDFFAPTLTHLGVEMQHWFGPAFAMRPGVAVFIDAARASGGSATGSSAVDAGIGLRWALPAGTGILRVDVATGLIDTAHALSLSVTGGLPDRD